MPYLTIQHSVHENLIQIEEVGEKDEDPCCIVVINTFVMGAPIRVTQEEVATTFDMSGEGLSDEHASYPLTMLIPNDNALDLQLNDRLLHLFISHFFNP